MSMIPRIEHHWSTDDLQYDITLTWSLPNGAGVRVKFRVGDEIGEFYWREPGTLPCYDGKPQYFTLDESIPEKFQEIFDFVAGATRVNRVEVIDWTGEKRYGGGRAFQTRRDDISVTTQLQDDGRTLKVFIQDSKPAETESPDTAPKDEAPSA